MARISKKVSAAQREAENAPHRIWKTAIYARLSDFDDVLRDTESLEVQISYIKEYINHRDDLMLLDVFADKRCTGMNFDRPEFERLLKALQERKVNCIVVKDFSRLGRNFVETGQYLEQVFPLFGVRFIAINDNYDSLNSQNRDGMLVPIKSMINEMYSKDLSQKIQSCFRSKEARGEIYTPVPFGYKRNQQNHLVLDEEVSDVVVRIFLWKKSGMKEREIAKKLSAQGIQTPFTRRCQLGYLKNTLRVKNPAWQTVFVTKVLENPIYTGTMVYNRIAYDETNRKIGQNPRESWRMVPDNHPAIISWELFDEVSALREAEQAVREERKTWCKQRRENNPNIFKGRIFCKECGEKLVCHWQSDGSLYFYCKFCHVSISEKDLWNGINKELHQRLEEYMLFDLEEAIMFTPKPQEYMDPLTGEMKKKQMKFFPDAYKNRIGKSYNDYIADHQMNMFEDFIGYQSSTVLDEPEREAGTTSIPIPQREESENTPSPDLPGQLENVLQSGNEIAKRGMPT